MELVARYTNVLTIVLSCPVILYFYCHGNVVLYSYVYHGLFCSLVVFLMYVYIVNP